MGTPSNMKMTSLLYCSTLQVQKGWMYLEPIFSAPDIQRQLPVEAKAFLHTDKQPRDIMRRTKDRPNALMAGTQSGTVPLQCIAGGHMIRYCFLCKTSHGLALGCFLQQSSTRRQRTNLVDN